MALPKPKKNCDIHINDLPKDLLESIFDRLWCDGKYFRVSAVADLIRVSAVCKNWQCVSIRVRKKSGAGPFILLPPQRNNDQVYHLHDLSKTRVTKIRIPETRNRWICNSWNEWLVTIDCLPDSNHQINMLNLFSRVEIQLPPPSTFQDPPPPLSATPIECFILKAIASTTPLDPNCVIMAIHSNYQKLAYCKLGGGTKWNTLKSERYVFKDMIYYKGAFYAVEQRGNLVVCDIECPEPRTVEIAAATLTWGGSQIYLVESSSGDLLQVIRTLDWEGDEGLYYTNMFKVFKMNFDKHEWQLINSLGGENTIFVGHNLYVSISAQDLPIRRDCIYFTDDNWEGYFRKKYGCHDNGVFDMKTKLIDPTFQFSQKWSYPLFWMTRV